MIYKGRLTGRLYVGSVATGVNFHFFLSNSKVNFTGFIKLVIAHNSAKYKPLHFCA
jgi:hypothetical protein